MIHTMWRNGVKEVFPRRVDDLKGIGLNWMMMMLGERHLRRYEAIVRINEMTPKTLTPSAWCLMLILALLSLTRQSLPLINVLPTPFLALQKESPIE